MPKATRRHRGGFDATSMAEAFAKPGMDPRQWISYGTVDDRTTDEETGEAVDPVTLDSDFGPLIAVTLQPSMLKVHCRIAIPSTGSCGAGESEYSPFVSGDEVLVAIPEGDEMALPAIIGRLNNGIDTFPENVGGQKLTDDGGNFTNRFAFQRRRTPFVQEWASTWMQRIASHGAFILISESGAWTLRDGAGGALQMGPDIFGYTEPATPLSAGGGHALSDPSSTAAPGQVKALFQMDLVGRRFVVQVDDAMFRIDSSKADGGSAGEGFLLLPTSLTVAFGPAINGVFQFTPAEHVATLEAVLALLEIGLGAIGGGFGVPALAAVNVALAAGGAPMGSFAATLATGLPLAAATPKLEATVQGGVQTAPGLGAVFFKTG